MNRPSNPPRTLPRSWVVLWGALLLLQAPADAWAQGPPKPGEHTAYPYALVVSYGQAYTEDLFDNQGDIGSVRFGIETNRVIQLGVTIERTERVSGDLQSDFFGGVMLFPFDFPLYVGLALGVAEVRAGNEFTTRASAGYQFDLGPRWFIDAHLNYEVSEIADNRIIPLVGIGRRF